MQFFFGNMDSFAFSPGWDFDHGSFIYPSPLSAAYDKTGGFYMYYRWHPDA